MQTKDVKKIISLNGQKYISEELYLSEITNSLLKLGFSPKLKGFIYVNGYAYTVEKESVSNEEIFKIFE